MKEGTRITDRNICKFITVGEAEQLITTQFIYESKAPYAKKPGILDTHAMYLVSEGEGILCMDGRSWTLSPGTIFFTFADRAFQFEAVKDLAYYYISFHGSRGEELFRRFAITPIACVFSGYEGLIPFWRDNLVRANEENADLLSESMLLYTFSKLKISRSSGNDLVSFVLSYLDAHFREHTLTLSQVAEAAGYHGKYLSHVFKKRFGVGFSEYLRVMRMKYAVMLIENGVTSVKNVAALSGFSDPLYFSKVFTEMMGISPSQFLKKDNPDSMDEQNKL